MIFELLGHLGVHVRHFVDDVSQSVALGLAQRTGPAHLIKQVQCDIREEFIRKLQPQAGQHVVYVVTHLALLSFVVEYLRPARQKGGAETKSSCRYRLRHPVTWPGSERSRNTVLFDTGVKPAQRTTSETGL